MSKSKKKGLGRGLSALFGDAKNQVNNNVDNYSKNSTASIGDLIRNPYQPRQSFNDKKLDELSDSIKKKWCNSAYSSKTR